MDFRRIQVVLLVFFMIFDGFLAYELHRRVQGQTTSSTYTTSVNLEDELAERGVQLNVKLEDKVYHLPIVKASSQNYLQEHRYELDNQQVSIDDNRLTSDLDEPLDFVPFIDPVSKNLADDPLPKISDYQPSLEILRQEDYHFSWFDEREGVFYFRMQPEKGYFVIDGTAEVQLLLDEDFQLQTYQQTYVADMKPLDHKTDLITDREALLKLGQHIDTYVPDNSRIVDISLGYYRSQTYEDFMIYSPCWKILYVREGNQAAAAMVDALKGNFIARNQHGESTGRSMH